MVRLKKICRNIQILFALITETEILPLLVGPSAGILMRFGGASWHQFLHGTRIAARKPLPVLACLREHKVREKARKRKQESERESVREFGSGARFD